MLLGGFTSNPSSPWPELYLFNRLAIAMNFLFAAFFKIYHSTRDRLETRNFDLAQRLATETDDVERAREIQKALMPVDLPTISAAISRPGGNPRVPSAGIILTQLSWARIAWPSPSAMSSAKAFPRRC